MILGERELAAGEATVRDLANGEQRGVSLDAVVAELSSNAAYTGLESEHR